MLKRTISISTTFLLFLSFLSTNIFACACCAEPGDYSKWKGKVGDYDLTVLEGMEFANQSNLYMNEAGYEVIKGLDAIVKNYPLESWVSSPLIFNSTHSFTQLKDSNFSINYWKLNFTTKHKKLNGTMILKVPEEMSQFKVDIHDGKKSGGGGPLLYKEWRFAGIVNNGSGFFKDGIDQSTKFKLIFQGRGNGCDNSEDFTNWQLAIKGDKADYKFFGEMSSGVKKDNKDLEAK